MKKCSRCGKVKDCAEFGTDKRASTGLRPECRTCGSKASGDWNRRHRIAYNAARLRYFETNRARVLITSAKSRAKKLGLAFDLTQHRAEIQRRIDAGYCEVSGFPFNLTGGRTFDSPSIDRIVPNLGYVYSNIRVVVDAMNLALGDWGEERLYAVVSAWTRKRQRERTLVEDANEPQSAAGANPVWIV